MGRDTLPARTISITPVSATPAASRVRGGNASPASAHPRNTAMTIYKISMLAEGFKGRPK